MSRNLSDKQKWALALAYSYAERNGGEPAPITELSEVFFDYDRGDYYLYSVKRSQLFQTRRLIQALIRRGLMEEAGTAIHSDAATAFWSGGSAPVATTCKGYTRVRKTYRLTDAGRAIGKAEDEATAASVRATEEASPKLKPNCRAHPSRIGKDGMTTVRGKAPRGEIFNCAGLASKCRTSVIFNRENNCSESQTPPATAPHEEGPSAGALSDAALGDLPRG